MTTCTLTGLFARTVATFPDRPAVSDDTETLTYTELDRRSDLLAAVLRERGVGHENRVGVYLDRSVDVFVAILGVLKAGGCYVAVDTRYPDQRRDQMLVGGEAKLVITRPEWLHRLAHLDLDVFGFRSVASTGPVVADGPEIVADQAASLLFTSGSSGAPKAIILEHGNLVSFAGNSALPALHEHDRVGQISSLSFDAFHFEIWTTFRYGAEVTVLPAVPDLLAADFQREMRRRRISAMLVPTMVINHVVREDRDAFAPLRLLQAGGDVLVPSACRELLRGAFTGELYNLYGPAEITTACTAQLVTEEIAARDAIPIGRPLDGVTVHVLTAELRDTAPGEVGELYVGGPGVARGYLGRPELTAERFVVSPFADGPRRLYRTGDLGRRGVDGVLEFVGRADSQVKVRGYRVELGEVEQALCRHPDVPEAVVLASGDGDGRHLVAFVVLDGGLTPRRLREHAEAQLPDFMVPSHFVALSGIPANEHGKRDQEALAELLAAHRAREDAYREPVNATEEAVAQLWADLLGVERAGRDDDFFELGGHSLLAFRLRSRISQQLGVDVPNSVVMGNTVLADLAAAVDELRDGGLV